MSAAIHQLPAKSLRLAYWFFNIILSAFLAWASLDHLMRPKELIDSIQRLGATIRLIPLLVALKSGCLIVAAYAGVFLYEVTALITTSAANTPIQATINGVMIALPALASYRLLQGSSADTLLSNSSTYSFQTT